MNALALTFEEHSVRVVMRNGAPWWVLADVCEVLEHSDPSMAASRLDEDEKGTSIVCTPGNDQEMLIVSEPGLYKLLMTSRKPQAKRFDRWVRHEVLPEIRRTGCYHGAAPSLDAIGNLFDQKLEPVNRGMAEMRVEIAEVRGNVTFLTKRVDDMAPRHDFTPNTRRAWAIVVWKFYSGSCPCCRKTHIVDDRREIKSVAHSDHFNGRERNDPGDGWLVCVGCNYRLTRDPQFKERAKAHFRVFQDYRCEVFGTRNSQSLRKRRCSKTSNDRKQGNLFD